jgi:methionyl-tRNA formyltransferase
MSSAALRVAFAGTPEFAAVALRAILAAGFEVPVVFTQPDRPAGRGLKLAPSAVKAVALEHGLSVAQPQGLRLDGRFATEAVSARDTLLEARADLMVVAAYGLILPQWVLDTPRLGCLNIHGSLLPRWRGAAPIQRAIEAGDPRTGITIIQMDAGLDTGPMLLEEGLDIGPADTSTTLYAALAPLGGKLIVQALAAAASGRLSPKPQPTEGVTYAHKIAKEEAVIDWALPAQTIERRLRAFDPFPGAATKIAGETVKVWRARAVAGAGQPGTVLTAGAQELVVACGDQALELLELQRPGARRQPVQSFLAGQRAPLNPGQALNPGA